MIANAALKIKAGRPRRPTAVSLFSGCGGSDAGVLQSGFEVLLANDVIPYARDVYLANHEPTEYVLGDVRKIESFPSADLLVGCYPCQGFSQGGVRDPSRSINYLYLEFRRALAQIRPKAFVVENVSGMVRENYKHLLDDQLRVFRLCGYRVKHQVLNSAHFGVPQERKRIFLVGIRSDIDAEYTFPTPTHGAETGTPFCTIGEALNGMPLWPKGEYYDREFHWYYLSRNRRQDWNETSKTIVSNPRHMPLHPVSPKLVKLEHNVWEFESKDPARRFSYREAARLQGFSNNLTFPESENSTLDNRYKVVGNAVPPPLFHAVVNAIPDIWN